MIHLNHMNTIKQGRNWVTEHMGRENTTKHVHDPDNMRVSKLLQKFPFWVNHLTHFPPLSDI